MRLSIVSTLYRSAPYLREFHRRAAAAARRYAGDDYEIVLVNDGSPDDALLVALGLRAADGRVRIIDLSRNFGHHAAMWIGLQQSRGEWVYLIDCDLEESPEWLASLGERQRETGADVVYGVQEHRGGDRLASWGGWLFYKLYNALSDEPIPANLMTVRLMSRRYVNALLQHSEVNFTISGLWARTGFRQVGVPLRKARKKSTTYTLLRRARLFVDAVTAFSSKPLTLIFYLGTAMLAASAAVGVGLTVRCLLFGAMLAGWPSLMVSVWFLGGLVIFCQGVLGVYLARVYAEAKRRPVAIIRQIYGSAEEAGHDRLRIAE